MSYLWELRHLLDKNDFEAANHGATGEAIYNAITQSFQNRNVPLNNVIGFASDGASTMIGQHNSVACLFLIINPGIMILNTSATCYICILAKLAKTAETL